MPLFKVKKRDKEERLKLKLKKIEEDRKKRADIIKKRNAEREKIRKEQLKKKERPEGLPDISAGQLDLPMITNLCPESIKAEELPMVRKYPEEYIEINVIKSTRVIDAFYIKAERKTFTYKKKRYDVLEDSIYLLPTRTGMFMPTCYYRENKNKPAGFKQMNTGITGKALSLLYMEQLYTSLLYAEDSKYNLFIVILSMMILIAYGIGCYFVFFHNGGFIWAPPPEDIPLVSQIISPLRMLTGGI